MSNITDIIKAVSNNVYGLIALSIILIFIGVRAFLARTDSVKYRMAAYIISVCASFILVLIIVLKSSSGETIVKTPENRPDSIEIASSNINIYLHYRPNILDSKKFSIDIDRILRGYGYAVKSAEPDSGAESIRSAVNGGPRIIVIMNRAWSKNTNEEYQSRINRILDLANKNRPRNFSEFSIADTIYRDVSFLQIGMWF